MKELVITTAYAGGRLDKLVLKYLDLAPQSFLYKMLRKKNIVLNGRKAKGNEILKEGDVIRLYLSEETVARFQKHPDLPSVSEEEAPEAAASAKSRDALSGMIVYEDENLLALNKPPGLLTQKAKPEDRSLNDLVRSYLEAAGADRLFTPGISNRLDRNTSGLVLAGKHPAAARELNRAIRDRSLDKFYLCLVRGAVQQGRTLDGYLIKDRASNKVRVLSLKEAEGFPQKSLLSRIRTVYRPLAQGENLTLLEVELVTGKSHQIRAHFASIGHPILGDGKYGDKTVNSVYNKRYGLNRQLLHAERVCFRELKGCLAGLNGRQIEAPLPEDFRQIAEAELSGGFKV